MIFYKKILTLFFALFCCYAPVEGQQHWFKGLWQYYQVSPDTMAAHTLRSDLFITMANDSSYTGIQHIFLDDDTAVYVKRWCAGRFADRTISFDTGQEIGRNESPGVNWDVYTRYAVQKSYITIREHKVVFTIEAKAAGYGTVKRFAYYRDLASYNPATQWMIVKKYGLPQEAITYVPVMPQQGNSTDRLINELTDAYSTDSSPLPVPDSLPAAIATRENTLVKTLNITSPDIQVVLLDDAEIDGDIISLYHNNELVLDHKTLGREVIKYTLRADRLHAHHEFILVAENLGSIPPNTALLRIRAGDVKYELVVRATLHANVKLVIDYVGN